MTRVAIRGLSVEFDGTRVLDGVDLDALEGSWTALIGPNGAGKTTLLRCVLGLQTFQGSVTLDGTEVTARHRRELARTVAYVPQRPAIPGGLRVLDYVLLGRTPHIAYLSTERPRDVELVGEVLGRLRLRAFADRPLASLSGGETQRAVLARALAQEARVLLLDEPTSALDVGNQQAVLELVDELRRERSLTILSAMHDLTLAGQFAEHLVLLSGGRTVARGSPREVLTPEIVERHYDASVRVLEGPGGQVSVVPARR